MIGVFSGIALPSGWRQGGFYQNGGDALPFKHRETRRSTFAALVSRLIFAAHLGMRAMTRLSAADGPRGDHE